MDVDITIISINIIENGKPHTLELTVSKDDGFLVLSKQTRLKWFHLKP